MVTSLSDVTRENWIDVISLEISKQQERYVATPAEAIAASKFYDYYINRAVCCGTEIVGFLQYYRGYRNYRDGKPQEIFIDQLLIDVQHQGKGYGTAAVALALEEIKNIADVNVVSICYVEGHDVMCAFFKRFGFSVVEQDEFDETIMELHLT
ncbi:GNAT family N-acetyltransferase [Halioxenophilus aromaticivorans]|uniref:GNAT family N-acetyltransferase n=1 Tax=Halioxenophilus aromaticivorans TaxID=1306992 RepID=UPI0031EA3521